MALLACSPGDGRRSGGGTWRHCYELSASAMPTSAAIRVLSRASHMMQVLNVTCETKVVPDSSS